MRLGKVTVRNYGSWYGEHTYNLAHRGLVLVEGVNHDNPGASSNGSGKSTLFDAIDWALWGKVPRGDHVDSIRNNETSDPTMVRVDVEDLDAVYQIERTRLTDKTELVFQRATPDGVTRDLTTLDVAETQRLIELRLGLDRDVFHAAVLRGQVGRLEFAEASQSERLEILTRILQLDEIDEILERVKARRKEAALQVVSRTGQQEMAVKMIANFTEVRDSLIASQQNWRSSTEATIATERKRQQDYLQVLAGQTVDTQPLEVRVAELAAMSVQADPAVQKLREQKDALAKHLIEVGQQLGKLEGFAESIQKQLQRMQGLPAGPCPTCGQPITGEHLAQEIGVLAENWQSRQAVIADLRQSKAKFKDQQLETERALTEAEQQHSKAVMQRDKAIQEVRQQLAAQATIQTYRAQAEASLKALEQQEAVLQQGMDPYTPKVAEVDGKLQTVRADLAKLQTELAEQMDLARHLEFLEEAFGPKGLKNYILDSKLQQLTDAANRWVSKLTGGSMWVQFVTQVATRTTKSVKNAIDLKVFRYENGTAVERNYRSWSGGECQRVALGVDFGLADLVASRATKRWNVLVLDELFRHLDRSGKEAVVEMLRELKSEKDSIFVIEHDPEFAEHFDQRVTVQKRAGRSSILDTGTKTEALGILRVEQEVPDVRKAGDGDPVAVEKPKRAPRKRRSPIHAPVPEPGPEGPARGQ